MRFFLLLVSVLSAQEIVYNDKLIITFNSYEKFTQYEKIYNLTQIKKLTKNVYLYKVENTDNLQSIIKQLGQLKDIKYVHEDVTKRNYLR